MALLYITFQIVDLSPTNLNTDTQHHRRQLHGQLDEQLGLHQGLPSVPSAHDEQPKSNTFDMDSTEETKPKPLVDSRLDEDPESALGTSYEARPNFVRRWIRKIGAEELGIERIPPEMRTDQPARDLFNVFFAANCNTATVALGYLGPAVFGMGWWDSFGAIVGFNLAAALLPSMMATLGPRLGLRTMVIQRFSFGWWPGRVLAVLSAINMIGWAIVNGISGAGVLYDAGDGKLPLAAAVVILGVVAIALGLFGYHAVHLYMKWSWVAVAMCFIVVAGFGAEHFTNVPVPSAGPAEASRVMSFATSIVGYQIAWATIAADYGVYMRETTPAHSSAGWMYLGLVVPQITLELLGAAIGSLIRSSDAHFAAAYTARGIGGLIGAVFEGHGPAARGFGKFVEVVISFATPGVVTANLYSLGLGVQVVSDSLLAVPRSLWCLIGGAAYLAAAVAGREHLEAVMENFLLICAYWVMPFVAVVFTEHFVWRRGCAYDLDAWNDPSRLPHGIAAAVAWLSGTAVSVLSMSQTWWVGPIARGIGGSAVGTDISWVLALVVVPVVYIPIRMWERRVWKL